MSRNSFFISAFFFVASVILIIFAFPVMAAAPGQDTAPPERLRPDQYSYHGKEDIPFLPSRSSPVVESIPIASPIEQWSKMVFETYTSVGDDWDITIADGDFSNLYPVTNNGSIDDIQPRLNRGCTRVAYASNQDGNYEIYTINVDGSHQTRLTTNAAEDVSPAWSPDGTRIAFQSYRDGNVEVYVMNVDGSGQTNLTMSSDYDGMPIWSPDGTKIAFISRRTGFYHVWVMNADGSNLVELSQQRYSEGPVWSPDGSQIGFDADSDNDGWQELWSMNADGSLQSKRATPTDNHTYWASGWSPDGLWLLYTDVKMISYQGNWYWENAWLYKLAQNGQAIYINQGHTMDWFLDWTTMDTQPPATGINALFSPLPYQFTVSWWGQDNWAGISGYEVQVRDGLSGAWTNWQTWTSETSAVFTGIGGHDYYFRIRGRDQGFTVQPWPAEYQATTQVESSLPFSQVRNLDPLTYGDHATLTWQGGDVGGSGILSYDLQFIQDATGVWENWLSGTHSTSAIFTGALGHTYYFRSRGIDNALNVEEWPAGDGDASTSFYSWRTFGSVGDNTGVPIAEADVLVDPPAFLTFPSDNNGTYAAYLANNPDSKTVSWSKDSYGMLPATGYGLADASADVYLPPTDNQIQDWGFESGVLPGAWQAGGTFTPTLDNTFYHTGEYAASMGSTTELGVPVFISSTLQLNEMFIPFAFDSHGGLHMAWADWNNGYHIYYSYRLPDYSWTPAELVTKPDTIVTVVRIVVDSEQNVHMVYALDTTGIYYTRRDIYGNWSQPEVISSSGWLTNVVFDDASNIHLIISMGSYLNYAHYEPGGAWELETIPYISSSNRSSIAVDGFGNLHLAWTFSFSSDSKVEYMQHQMNGSWSEPILISKAQSAYSIDILLDSKNLPHVVWTDTSDHTSLVYSSRLADGSWSDSFILSGETDVYQLNMLIDKQDTFYFVWDENAGDLSTNGIYFTQVDKDGIWSHPQKISQSSNAPSNVNAIISGGDIYAVWEEESGLNTDVFYARRHANVWSSPLQLSYTPLYSAFPHIETDLMGGVNIAWCETNDNDIHDLYYLGSLPLAQDEHDWLSQSLTVPVTITNPTLSFLASLSGVSNISGNEFSLQVGTDIYTTTLFTSTTSSSWEHHWFDLTPWSGERITLTFKLLESANFPPANVLLDEVTLGAAHSDVWVDLAGGTRIAHPGDQFNYQLVYGDHGGVPASATIITMTLPLGLNYIDATIPPDNMGNQLVWQVGDLPAGSVFDAIDITVGVDASAPLLQTVVTSVEISTASPELEKLNNSSQSETYLGYLQLLPFLKR